jgi:hypothetical protein
MISSARIRVRGWYFRRILGILPLLAAVFISAPWLFGQLQQKPVKRVLRHERDVETGMLWQRSPVWRAGRLVGVMGEQVSAPVIYTVDRDGRRDEILFTLEEAARITIHNVTASPTGEIASVGYAVTDDLRNSTFLVRIAADRKSQVITRTWPYAPKAVTFASDGTLWTIGNLFNEDMTRDVAYHVLRRFDPSGRVLSTKTLRIRGTSDGDAASYFYAFGDRVGWLTIAGEYIEFALDGAEIALRRTAGNR